MTELLELDGYIPFFTDPCAEEDGTPRSHAVWDLPPRPELVSLVNEATRAYQIACPFKQNRPKISEEAPKSGKYAAKIGK